jgi:hypothetical protein
MASMFPALDQGAVCGVDAAAVAACLHHMHDQPAATAVVLLGPDFIVVLRDSELRLA